MVRPSAITCIGYTMGPSILARDKRLAVRRGAEICNYLKEKHFPGVGITSKAVNTKVLNPKLRRTVVYLRF
jgi:hypothetical protein